MLRLFKVVDDADFSHFFKHKRMAKVFVADLREANPRGDYVVMRGPDHNKGESFNKSSQMQKKGKR